MTDKKIKRLTLSLLLVVILSFPGEALASPEFSRSEDEWAKLRDNTMEYGEIEDLIHEYNATVLNNQLEYSRQRDDPTADDIAQAYRDAADDIRSTIIGDDDNELSDALAEAQARQLDKNADDNVVDLVVLNDSNTQTEKNLVMVAQTDFITYQQSLLNLEVLKQQKELLTETLRVVENQETIGTASSLEVLEAKNNLQSTEASIIQTEASIKKLEQTLCVMMGWQYNASPKIGEIASADLKRIEAMNPDIDVENAISNNYELKMNQRKLENAESEIIRDTYRNTIKDNKEKIGTDVVNKYQAVLQTEIAFKQAESELEEEKKNMDIASQKMSLGSISQLEYLQEQTTYLSKQAAYKNADMDLFEAMEMYDWSVNGMASVE